MKSSIYVKHQSFEVRGDFFCFDRSLPTINDA